MSNQERPEHEGIQHLTIGEDLIPNVLGIFLGIRKLTENHAKGSAFAGVLFTLAPPFFLLRGLGAVVAEVLNFPRLNASANCVNLVSDEPEKSGPRSGLLGSRHVLRECDAGGTSQTSEDVRSVNRIEMNDPLLGLRHTELAVLGLNCRGCDRIWFEWYVRIATLGTSLAWRALPQ